MSKAWNAEGRFFGQSYEDTDLLDSAVLIMPLVFFMHGVRAPFLLSAGSAVDAGGGGGGVVGPKVCEHAEADIEDA